jgi:hypothetical protein
MRFPHARVLHIDTAGPEPGLEGILCLPGVRDRESLA